MELINWLEKDNNFKLLLETTNKLESKLCFASTSYDIVENSNKILSEFNKQTSLTLKIQLVINEIEKLKQYRQTQSLLGIITFIKDDKLKPNNIQPKMFQRYFFLRSRLEKLKLERMESIISGLDLIEIEKKIENLQDQIMLLVEFSKNELSKDEVNIINCLSRISKSIIPNATLNFVKSYN